MITYKLVPVVEPDAKPAVNEFHPWRCEKCGRYHHKLFPDDGCEVCKGENIAVRLCRVPEKTR